jgi:hypothetical protein
MGRQGMEYGLVRFEPNVVDRKIGTRIPHHIFGREFHPRVQRPTLQKAPSERILMARRATVDGDIIRPGAMKSNVSISVFKLIFISN